MVLDNILLCVRLEDKFYVLVFENKLDVENFCFFM